MYIELKGGLVFTRWEYQLRKKGEIKYPVLGKKLNWKKTGKE